MKKTLQIWSALILFLFLFPVIINYLPKSETSTSSKLIKEPAMIVYASNVMENVMERDTPVNGERKALLYFTHSHEAFEPVTKAKNGKVAVSHQSENITKFGEKLKTQLDFNGVKTDILDFDNARDMQKKSISYGRAYKSIRPQVEKSIKEKDYDLIIDLHRDSIGPNRTTITHNGEQYANVAFVIGMDHANAAKNEALAKQLKQEMELLVPGITRNLVKKSGRGVDGKYNQDLHASILLVELGGIGNSEDQLNRTIAVLAKASANLLSKDVATEN